MKRLFLTSLLALVILAPVIVKAQQTAAADKITWYSIKEATELNKKKPKKIFIDVFTDWCGWCKKMDQSTFPDPTVIKYMNKYFYAVKFNAEARDTVLYLGNTYVNPNPKSSRSTHQLATTLLQGQLYYPSFVILDEKMAVITKTMGYKEPKDVEPLLRFYGENAHKKKTYEVYMQSFKSEIK
jgi:thioredoxin-related protein